MAFYAVERALEFLQRINTKIYNPHVREYGSLNNVNKELKTLVSMLYDLFKMHFYEPRITYLIMQKGQILNLLNACAARQELLRPKLRDVVVNQAPFIIDSFQSWQVLFDKKISPFIEGNQYLTKLPSHPNPDRFYIYVKELNPINLALKHPLDELQARDQARRSVKELLAFDENDPIIARRSFDSSDRLNAPGSRIFIAAGHHRIYELYRRYLMGRIKGNLLLEAVKAG